MQKRTFTAKVKETDDRTRNTKKLRNDKTYKMVLRHSTGYPKITIVDDEPFPGFSSEDPVKVTVTNIKDTVTKAAKKKAEAQDAKPPVPNGAQKK